MGLETLEQLSFGFRAWEALCRPSAYMEKISHSSSKDKSLYLQISITLCDRQIKQVRLWWVYTLRWALHLHLVLFKRNKASLTPQEHRRGRTAPRFHHSKEDILIFLFDSTNVGKLFLWRLASRTLPADPGFHDLAGLIGKNVLSPLNEYLEQAPIPLFVLSFKN